MPLPYGGGRFLKEGCVGDMKLHKDWVGMNEHNCINCGEGWYDGYEADRPLTRPCQVCGHQAPARMSKRAFMRAIHKRDKKLAKESKTR